MTVAKLVEGPAASRFFRTGVEENPLRLGLDRVAVHRQRKGNAGDRSGHKKFTSCLIHEREAYQMSSQPQTATAAMAATMSAISAAGTAWRVFFTATAPK
jgi:hypothetical protein